MLTVRAECGLVTTNEREVIRKVNAKFYDTFYTFSLFGCPGACLLKVPVIVGPKTLFFRYQWLWNSNYGKSKKTKQNRLVLERIPTILSLRLRFKNMTREVAKICEERALGINRFFIEYTLCCILIRLE